MLQKIVFGISIMLSNGAFSATPAEIDDAAFDAALKKQFPVSPDKIIEYRKMEDQVERAKALPIHNIAKSVHTSVTVDLSPGANLPVVKMAPNNISSIVVLDNTGQAWPVLEIDKTLYPQLSVQHVGQQKNIINITPMFPYGRSNLMLMLQGLDVPLAIRIQVGQHDELDDVKEIVINRAGPFAAAPVVENPVAGFHDLKLDQFIDRIPPPKAEKLTISGASQWSEAWLYNDLVYLRTTALLKSPAYLQKGSSADGTFVYVFNPSPVVIVSDRGQQAKWRIKE